MNQPQQPPGPWGPPPSGPAPNQAPIAPYGQAAPAGFGQQALADDPPPDDYKNAGLFMLISGVVNVIMSALLFIILILMCVGVFWLLPLGAAIFELVVGWEAYHRRFHRYAKLASIFGIIAAFFCANPIGIGCEIVALIALSKPDVAHWLQRRSAG